MTIFYYSTDTPRTAIRELAKIVEEKFGNDVLFLPKSFDVLLDAPIEQLEEVKKVIDKAIDRKKAE